MHWRVLATFKRLGAALLISACALAAAPPSAAQTPQDARGMDVVVLLQASRRILPRFAELRDYVVSSVIRDYLRFGDDFHLLSFGETTQVEIAQRMGGEQDARSVLSRLYLVYPLEARSDLVGALGYLYQYVSDLPEGHRKAIIVISDGISDPPETSPFFGLSPQEAAERVGAIAARFRSAGWPVRFIAIPQQEEASGSQSAAPAPSGPASASGAAVPAAGQAGGPASSAAPGGQGTSSGYEAAVKALGTDAIEYSSEARGDIAMQGLALPRVSFPDHLGSRGYRFALPLGIENLSDSPLGVELVAVMAGSRDLLERKTFLSLSAHGKGQLKAPLLLPDSLEPGERELQIELRFGEGLRVSPYMGSIRFRLVRRSFPELLRSGMKSLAFTALVILGLGVAIGAFLLVRRAKRKAEAPVVATVRESSKPRREGVERHSLTAGAVSGSAAGGSTGSRSLPSGTRPTGTDSLDSAREREVESAARALAAAAKAEERERMSVLASAADRARSERAAAPAAAGRKPDASAEKLQPRLSAARPRVGETQGRSAASVPIYAVRRPGSVQIELRVEDQNPHIGARNIHTMQAGGSKTVGGGRSDFLVFLVRVPSRAARIVFDGENLNLVPLKPELFPDSLGEPIEGCLDKPIRMINMRGYPLTLRFTRYERPVERINRLLHCIDAPGLFGEGFFGS